MKSSFFSTRQTSIMYGSFYLKPGSDTILRSSEKVELIH